MGDLCRSINSIKINISILFFYNDNAWSWFIQELLLVILVLVLKRKLKKNNHILFKFHTDHSVHLNYIDNFFQYCCIAYFINYCLLCFWMSGFSHDFNHQMSQWLWWHNLHSLATIISRTKDAILMVLFIYTNMFLYCFLKLSV